jgi:hypothetical protein
LCRPVLAGHEDAAVGTDAGSLVHGIKETAAGGDLARRQRCGLGLAQREAGEEESDDRLLLLDICPVCVMSMCGDPVQKQKVLPLCTKTACTFEELGTGVVRTCKLRLRIGARRLHRADVRLQLVQPDIDVAERGQEAPAPVREPALDVAPHVRARAGCDIACGARRRAQERRAWRCVLFVLRVALIPLVCARIGGGGGGGRRWRRVEVGEGVQRGTRRVVVVLCAEDLVQPQRHGVARLCLR